MNGFKITLLVLAFSIIPLAIGWFGLKSYTKKLPKAVFYMIYIIYAIAAVVSVYYGVYFYL